MEYKKYASKDVAWEVINSIERGENIGYTAYSQLERIKNEWPRTDLSREAERLIRRRFPEYG